jgi:predicted Rossmann fold flavoprotein
VASSEHSIIVVGGGAAGMTAAWRAASLGCRVVLLEKNARLGIKILVSGGGKCNVTHGGTMEEMRLRFRTPEARFLRHAFHSFSNADVRAMLASKGVATYERPNGKIFPVNEKAGDIVHAFRRTMEDAGVEIRCSCPVTEIRRDGEGVCGIALESSFIESRHVILATGGVSYKKTGTTGDGYRWAEALGHSIVPLRAALAPIVTTPVPPREWQGVAVRGGSLIAHAGGTILGSYAADILFTHFGISGPAVLELSSDIVRAAESNAGVSLAIDFLPDATADAIDAQLVEDIRANGAQEIKTWLELWLPQRLVPYFCDSIAVDGSTKCRQLKKEDRRLIVRTLKQWTFGSVNDIDIDRGEVTSGGIPLSEVDPKSMRSRIVRGFYCCGEVLDIAGPVGGYNLQAAFSTGFVAGTSAAFDASNPSPV